MDFSHGVEANLLGAVIVSGLLFSLTSRQEGRADTLAPSMGPYIQGMKHIGRMEG